MAMSNKKKAFFDILVKECEESNVGKDTLQVIKRVAKTKLTVGEIKSFADAMKAARYLTNEDPVPGNIRLARAEIKRRLLSLTQTNVTAAIEGLRWEVALLQNAWIDGNLVRLKDSVEQVEHILRSTKRICKDQLWLLLGK